MDGLDVDQIRQAWRDLPDIEVGQALTCPPDYPHEVLAIGCVQAGGGVQAVRPASSLGLAGGYFEDSSFRRDSSASAC